MRCFWLILALSVALNASAQDPLKIAFVDMDRLLQSSPQVSAQRGILDQEFRPSYDQLETEDQAVRDLEERLIRDGATMTADAAQKLELETRTRRRRVDQAREDLRTKMDIRRNELWGDLKTDLERLGRRYALENDYDLILISEVLYTSETVDITDDLLEFVRKSYQNNSLGEQAIQQ